MFGKVSFSYIHSIKNATIKFYRYFFLLLMFKPIPVDLVNVFEVFLPQLLLYPNPSDPLNGEAAALMMRDRASYEQRVKGNEIPLTLCIYTSDHFSLQFSNLLILVMVTKELC